jgi:hypothetical protein
VQGERFLNIGREVLVRLLKCVLVGGILVSAGQAYADDDAVSEIRVLKAKLKQLEQRVDDQGRKEKVFEAQAKALPGLPGPYKALPVDPCAPGKLCYKGVTLTFGGWIDLTGIYRSRNLASDTGSVYNFIPFPQAKNFNTPESRFSSRQTRFSVLAEGDPFADTHIAGYGEIDFEGAHGCASSASASIAPISAFMSSPAKLGRSMPRARPASIRAASMRPA